LQRVTGPLVAAMNKGCHCFSTALTKTRETKECLKFVLQLIALLFKSQRNQEGTVADLIRERYTY